MQKEAQELIEAMDKLAFFDVRKFVGDVKGTNLAFEKERLNRIHNINREQIMRNVDKRFAGGITPEEYDQLVEQNVNRHARNSKRTEQAEQRIQQAELDHEKAQQQLEIAKNVGIGTASVGSLAGLGYGAKKLYDHQLSKEAKELTDSIWNLKLETARFEKVASNLGLGETYLSRLTSLEKLAANPFVNYLNNISGKNVRHAEEGLNTINDELASIGERLNRINARGEALYQQRFDEAMNTVYDNPEQLQELLNRANRTSARTQAHLDRASLGVADKLNEREILEQALADAQYARKRDLVGTGIGGAGVLGLGAAGLGLSGISKNQEEIVKQASTENPVLNQLTQLSDEASKKYEGKLEEVAREQKRDTIENSVRGTIGGGMIGGAAAGIKGVSHPVIKGAIPGAALGGGLSYALGKVTFDRRNTDLLNELKNAESEYQNRLNLLSDYMNQRG